MPKYLVTISQEIEVEADDIDDANVEAAQCFDFGSADFETEEID